MKRQEKTAPSEKCSVKQVLLLQGSCFGGAHSTLRSLGLGFLKGLRCVRSAEYPEYHT